jgi:hypothetical protein
VDIFAFACARVEVEEDGDSTIIGEEEFDICDI